MVRVLGMEGWKSRRSWKGFVKGWWKRRRRRVAASHSPPHNWKNLGTQFLPFFLGQILKNLHESERKVAASTGVKGWWRGRMGVGLASPQQSYNFHPASKLYPNGTYVESVRTRCMKTFARANASGHPIYTQETPKRHPRNIQDTSKRRMNVYFLQQPIGFPKQKRLPRDNPGDTQEKP